MARFIQDHQHTHSVDMIRQATGASREFIINVFIELDIEPLQATDLRLKFLLENPDMSPGEAAASMKVTPTYVSILLNKKPSPRVWAAIKHQKQTA